MATKPNTKRLRSNRRPMPKSTAMVAQEMKASRRVAERCPACGKARCDCSLESVRNAEARRPRRVSKATEAHAVLASTTGVNRTLDGAIETVSDLGRVAAAKVVNQSRSDRWAAAVNKAQLAKSDLDDAIEVLAELRGEYEEWRDAMPENLHGSSTYEKLDAVCDLDIDRDQIMDSLDWLDEADGIDLPVGFGRD